MLETKAGPNDCHVTRFSFKHLACFSFVFRCFEPISCGILKLKCVSSVATNAKQNQLIMFEAVCDITCEKPGADSGGEE